MSQKEQRNAKQEKTISTRPQNNQTSDENPQAQTSGRKHHPSGCQGNHPMKGAYPGLGEGDPNRWPGYPGMGGGQPGMWPGYSGMGGGQPGMWPGYPGMGGGQPGMWPGYPGMGGGYPGIPPQTVPSSHGNAYWDSPVSPGSPDSSAWYETQDDEESS